LVGDALLAHDAAPAAAHRRSLHDALPISGGEPIILEMECFSIYSLISSLIMDSLVPNNSSASAFVNSVLPTPVGPTNKNEPIGRYLDLSPARLLLTAFATLSTASS